MRRIAVLFVLLALAGCHGGGPTEPSSGSVTRGRLAGVVTIGPFCPVTTTQPCPTPPSAFTERKVLVYNEGGTELLVTVDIDTFGVYLVALQPGRYLVDVKKVGADHSSDVPKVVTIEKNLTTPFDIHIDTGIR